MEVGRALARLRAHQEQIRNILADVHRPLAEEGAESLKALALARWHLMRLLREYQLFKHTELFDPMIKHADPERSRVAAAMKARCTALGDAYGDHVRKWSLLPPFSAWPDYRQEARIMSERILSHLRREREDAEQLLADIHRTRRPNVRPERS